MTEHSLEVQNLRSSKSYHVGITFFQELNFKTEASKILDSEKLRPLKSLHFIVKFGFFRAFKTLELSRSKVLQQNTKYSNSIPYIVGFQTMQI